MKFSCCIEMIYAGLPFEERIGKTARAGFDYFEFWNWDNKDIEGIKKAISKYGIHPATFQGSLNGVMVDKNDKAVYMEDVKRSLKVAKELGAKTLFCMSDIMQEDRSVKPHPRFISGEEAAQSSVDVLKALAPLAEDAGITLICEPLNTLVDHAGYSLYSTKAGVEIIKEVNSPSVKLLYDAYHMQVMEGNIIDTIRGNVQYFGHFHIADVPGRHQPGTGEMNYINIVHALKESGYKEAVGFEFSPLNGDDDSIARNTLKSLKNA
jgi:hydroxypyruvate isomerase